MSKEERYAEHTVAWELPNGDSVTKSNYNLAGIETKYIPIQTEVISDDKDKRIADLEAKLTESEKKFIIANNLRKNSDEVLLNYKTEKYGLDKTIQELRKMKLSLPEKEWYYKGFENCERQMSSYIADLTLEVKELKQQLAESEKALDEVCIKMEDEVSKWVRYSSNIDRENQQLKQQLAEKDKEIKNATLKHLDMLRYFIRHNSKQGIILSSDLEREIKEIEQGEKIWQTKSFNQDKISFAVEQLEKVKDYNYTLRFGSSAINEFIDNQIEELKKEMK